jgi:hypothetical protein
MVKRRSVAAALLLVGCANIWGFDDLEEKEPEPPPIICATYLEPCPRGCDPCSSRCVNLSTDTANCGSCGTQCTGGRACEGGMCVCEEGTEVCGGLCVNITTDTMNCGGCGIACDAGGACNDGSCTLPVVLSMGQGSPGAIVVDASRIYFVGGSTLYSMAKDGSDLVTHANAVATQNLAVDAESIYYNAISSLEKVSISGGTPTILATPTTSAGAIAIDSTDVYWVESASVNKVPIAGGMPTVLTTTPVNSTAIAVDADRVYYSYSYDVYTTPLTGGSMTRFDSASTTVVDIVLDAGVVFVAAGGIRAISIDEGTAETLATASVQRLVVDADNVYFFSGSSLSKVPRSGGDVTVLAIDASARDLAVDDTNVYWTSSGTTATGVVMTVPK